MNKLEAKKVIKAFPKIRKQLPKEYQEIYGKHYSENRNAKTLASKATAFMEAWGHRQVARTACKLKTEGNATLEIGAGTLNQFRFETKIGIYDIVEPYEALYHNSKYRNFVDTIYADISNIPNSMKYDRITALYSFEHILNLPEVIQKAALLLKEDGALSVAIPNEGRFLWKFAYQNTSGREYKRRYGLNYEVIMRYEHVNSADEIEILLRYYFKSVKMKLFGVGRELAFYRYFCCSDPILEKCNVQMLEKQ